MVATWQLSNINGRIVASLKKEAATAQMNAVKAMTAAAELQTVLQKQGSRAAKVEEAVAIAYKTAKEAEARALSFEAQIASANARAKEADARAVQAQLNLSKT